jgi:hypothetical protein
MSRNASLQLEVEMTDMDRIYLRALCEMDTMMLPHTQRGVFSSTMVRVQREMEME